MSESDAKIDMLSITLSVGGKEYEMSCDLTDLATHAVGVQRSVLRGFWRSAEMSTNDILAETRLFGEGELSAGESVEAVQRFVASRSGGDGGGGK